MARYKCNYKKEEILATLVLFMEAAHKYWNANTNGYEAYEEVRKWLAVSI